MKLGWVEWVCRELGWWSGSLGEVGGLGGQ